MERIRDPHQQPHRTSPPPPRTRQDQFQGHERRALPLNCRPVTPDLSPSDWGEGARRAGEGEIRLIVSMWGWRTVETSQESNWWGERPREPGVRAGRGWRRCSPHQLEDLERASNGSGGGRRRAGAGFIPCLRMACLLLPRFTMLILSRIVVGRSWQATEKQQLKSSGSGPAKQPTAAASGQGKRWEGHVPPCPTLFRGNRGRSGIRPPVPHAQPGIASHYIHGISVLQEFTIGLLSVSIPSI